MDAIHSLIENVEKVIIGKRPIIVTAAAPHIPWPLLDQLRVGGRLVIPVGEPYSYQELKVLEKNADGKIETQNVLGVSFVPLTGKHSTNLYLQDD